MAVPLPLAECCFFTACPLIYYVLTDFFFLSDFDIGKHEADIVLAEQEMRPHEGQETVVQLGEGEGSGKQVCIEIWG